MREWTDLDRRLPADDMLSECAYLVARGVRPLALAEHFPAHHLLRVATRIECHADVGAIPWVIDHGDGVASCGYASERWVLDLYEWAVKGPVPEEQRERIIGLLLGYSAAAIREFEAHGSGRRFATGSLVRASRSQLSGNVSTEETSPRRSARSAWRGSYSGRCRTCHRYVLYWALTIPPIAVGFVATLYRARPAVIQCFPLLDRLITLRAAPPERAPRPSSTGRGSWGLDR